MPVSMRVNGINAAALTSPESVSFRVAQNSKSNICRKGAILENAENLLLKRNETSTNKRSSNPSGPEIVD